MHTNNHRIYSTVIQSEITLFQAGKQFDALVVDTSAPVFDTVASDTLNVSKSILQTQVT